MKTTQELEKIKISLKDGEKTARVFSALGDERRLTILKLLIDHEGICVSEIAKVNNISVAAASQHLSILENTGMIKRTREGQMTCYKVESQNPYIKMIKHVMKSS